MLHLYWSESETSLATSLQNGLQPNFQAKSLSLAAKIKENFRFRFRFNINAAWRTWLFRDLNFYHPHPKDGEYNVFTAACLFTGRYPNSVGVGVGGDSGCPHSTTKRYPNSAGMVPKIWRGTPVLLRLPQFYQGVMVDLNSAGDVRWVRFCQGLPWRRMPRIGLPHERYASCRHAEGLSDVGANFRFRLLQNTESNDPERNKDNNESSHQAPIVEETGGPIVEREHRNGTDLTVNSFVVKLCDCWTSAKHSEAGYESVAPPPVAVKKLT